MVGRFCDEKPEYNVMVDIPASQKIFSNWPGEMAIITWEPGTMIKYPASSIENDFNRTSAHPLKEAYIRYQNVPYDNVMFEPIAVVYGAGEKENIEIDDNGTSRFTSSKNGKARIIYMSELQVSNLREYFRAYLTRKPYCRKNLHN